MTCDTRNCVYVIECTGCYKYYIGETGNFRLKLTCIETIRKRTRVWVSTNIYFTVQLASQ